MDIRAIAEKLRDKLRKYEEFQGLYIYGSRIKGNYKNDSDIDIVAVFDKAPDYKQELKISGEVIDIELEDNVFIDFHPMTIEELKLNYIFYNEVKKGIFYAV